MINSKEIYEKLKETVFGQDEYIKKLALFGYKHQMNLELINTEEETVNNNLLVVGPSGCGKTFAVRQLAKIIDIPFYEVDCSTLVQVGYKGANDINVSMQLLKKKYGDLAGRAIVYLDEFDKIFDQSLYQRGGGTSSQCNFLKILENSEVVLEDGRYDKDIINTTGISFIATGSFEMVKEKFRKTEANRMGFNNKSTSTNGTLTKEDLIKFGFMPELIGRFSDLININQLTKEDMFNIVKYSKKSPTRNYLNLFEKNEVKVEIDDSVYRKIADEAYNSTTGARNVFTELNKVFDDCLYKISSKNNINKIKFQVVNNQIKQKYVYGNIKNIDFNIDKPNKNSVTKSFYSIERIKKMIKEILVELDFSDFEKEIAMRIVLTNLIINYSKDINNLTKMKDNIIYDYFHNQKFRCVTILDFNKKNLLQKDNMNYKLIKIMKILYDHLSSTILEERNNINE